ncbi:hypothetical protein ASE98_09050 [Pseudomonas sp. Leaf48]|jgi:hypothetical protein|uniref:hypothetical protein n=1 Tax=unclassified Pseudomonas TaxID=196821 RepID=UPI00072BA89F|nr:MULTISPECIES: hypothetical protein [unclassified Pseudomonas]KQN43819.1 hypothetical protein ASE98_09050 [Pseudomonas sp. Leaf48]MBV7480536.1 hypothetical protein [Pseudomonas sp. PDM31]
MNRLLRVLLVLKVLVMLSLGSATAWAECEKHETQASNAQAGQGELMIAASDSEPGDMGQGGSAGNDDATTDEPDSDDPDEGDSQT